MIFIDSLVELIQSWWNLKINICSKILYFESLHENSLLSLEKDVSGPSNETGHISGVLDVTSDSEVSGLGFEQRVFDFLDGFFLSNFV